eukprot:SAG11_NODE_381_length_9941_cov_11.761885_10_plen_46_part_00
MSGMVHHFTKGAGYEFTQDSLRTTLAQRGGHKILVALCASFHALD